MTPDEASDHTNALRVRFHDVILSYCEAHPDIPAQVVAIALGETLMSLGVMHMGINWTKELCDELKRSVDRFTT